ncbi:shikimate O-hydroxycinnamoyltransferase-like [Abrus precatorius]|uniref:Shikimate O-hydroxycinnamoyltransferase-like n=1 Tax=Abrus precatorius TaxID=3816 RepID=A0A8B8LAM2_ABRPR|nr:shikimate O-hydroxycinnamoyltransferase-like [Abrus precatorius]
MSNFKVTLNSKLTVVSSRPVSSGKSHILSALDHSLGYHSLHIIFYYENEDNLFESFDLDPLRESLSEVLTLYPTVTGRLARVLNHDFEFKCNDAGVRVIKATVDTTLRQWLSSASGSQEKLLIAWDDMPHDPETWSPFRIQINSFEGGGVAIGLSCSHMVADLTCAASFFKSWTEAHSHIPITHPPSFTPLPNHPNAHSLPPYAPTSSPITRTMATATFKFSDSIIKQCLSKVNDTCPNATPFDFLSALFWTRIARLKPPKSHDKTHSLSICTDFRNLLKASLPTGYFGNALHFSMLTHNVDEPMESAHLGGIVSLVHKHLEGLREEEIWSNVEWLKSQELRSTNCMYGPELTCVCMEHLMSEKDHDQSLLYAAMFNNKERPAHVSCRVGNVEGEGLIMVMPSSEGGLARTVMVMVAEEELAELRKDEAILQLEPTIFLADCVVDN